MLKHWLKRQFKITVALVVGFLITGGTSFAGSIEDLEKRVAELEKKQVHYFSVNSDDSAAPGNTNYNNDGATGENSIVIGKNSSSSGNNSAVLGNSVKVENNKNGLNNSIVLGNNIEVDGVHNAIVGTDYENYDHKTTHVFGEQNTVIGVGNLVGWTAEQNGTTYNYTKASSGSDQNTVVGMKNTVKGSGSVVVGSDSEVGSLAVSFGYGNTIIDSNVIGGGQHGVALGNYLKVAGEKALAIGSESESIADWTISIGDKTKAEKTGDIALGKEANAKGSWSIALGWGSNANNVTGVALGYSAQTDSRHGVALGAYSKESTAAGVAGYDPTTRSASTETGIAWKSNLGAISVGEKNKFSRQITNVAAGSEDTDAVNVAQLKAVANQVTTVTTNLNNKANTNLDNITNEGKKVITGLVDVKGSNGIQVTTTTDEKTQKKTFDIALNKDLTDKINKEESVSEADKGMISVDSSKKNSTGGKDFVVDLKQEVKNKINSIGTGKIKEGDKNTVTGETVYNYVKTATTNANIAYKGGDEKSSKTVKSSEGFHFKGDANIKVSTGDNGVINHTLNSDLTGITSISNEKTKITLGKDNTIDMGGAEITKIAKGEVSATSTDAINGSQLQETNTKVEKLEKDSMKQIDAIYKTAEDVKSVKKEVGHVGALGAALAGLHPMQYDPLQPNQVMAGIGGYRDNQAVAVGVTHYFNENLMMTAGVSVGNENRVKTMANVGLTWKIGKDDDRKDLPERYKEGPIGSIYMMQEEVEGLLQENKVQKTKLREQEDKIAEQQQQINKIEKQLELLLKQK